MRAANLKLADPVAAWPAGPPNPGPGWLEFASYLARKHAITGSLVSKPSPGHPSAGQKRLRELWELTSLSANDFADEVGRFFRLPRVSLPQLMDAMPLAAQFSPRFPACREKPRWPFTVELEDGRKPPNISVVA